jgi:hypothetical protein
LIPPVTVVDPAVYAVLQEGAVNEAQLLVRYGSAALAKMIILELVENVNLIHSESHAGAFVPVNVTQVPTVLVGVH